MTAMRTIRNVAFAMMAALGLALTPSTAMFASTPSDAADRFCVVEWPCYNYYEWADCSPPYDCADAFSMCVGFCEGSPAYFFCSDDGNHTFGQCGCSFECEEG